MANYTHADTLALAIALIEQLRLDEAGSGFKRNAKALSIALEVLRAELAERL